MRSTLPLLIIAVFCGLSGCSTMTSRREAQSLRSADMQQSRAEPTDSKASLSLEQEKFSDTSNATAQPGERKIIKNAALTVEVASPTESQPKIVSIAESHQGFVITSEVTQRSTEDKAQPDVIVNLVVRVPAAQFNQVLGEIRAVGIRVSQEKITGEDVTQEFIDLEARIKNQKALEGQFIEIMKRAAKVEDALQVQRELANVRTEIEKLEGRRRFLENQASLSTINVTLQTPTQIVVNAAGFWFSLKSAFRDGFDVALAIIIFLIRAIIALLPVVVLIILPLALLARFVQKRVRRRLAKRSREKLESEG